jgi:hypothetical protein
MGVRTSEVGYTSATTSNGDHEVHKGHVVALGGKKKKKRPVGFMFTKVQLRRNILVLTNHRNKTR